MNNNDMQQNLYRILRMNIILAKSNGEIVSEDTLQSFEETAKKIDESANVEYEKNIKNLYYTTSTLEEESRRLAKLISIIEERLEERKNLLIDYRETTNRILEALGYIKDEDKLDDYVIREKNIKTYLSNKENIIKIQQELKKMHEELDTRYNDKETDESNNFELEDDLLLTYKDIVSSSLYPDVLSAVDIDFELEKLRPSVEDARKTLQTFETAFNNLRKAGINIDTEVEYSGYVEDAKKAYYHVKEKEFLYQIYKVITDSKNTYGELYTKRDSLDKIIEQRLSLRVEINVFEEDILTKLYELIDKQNKKILKQKENIDSICEIEETIKFKEQRLIELKDDNQRVEILSLLQEFGIIDTYRSETIEPKEEKTETIKEVELKVEEPEEKEQIPNMIVEVKDIYPNLNLGFAKSKADTVMRRVGRSIGCTNETKKEIEQEPQEELEIPSVTQNIDTNVELPVIENTNNIELPIEESIPTEPKQEEKPIPTFFENIEMVNPTESFKLPEIDEKNVDPEFTNALNGVTYPSFETEVSNFDMNEIPNQIDNDFWSVEDKEIFPTFNADNNYKVNQDNSNIKLGFPVDFGGNDENRN